MNWDEEYRRLNIEFRTLAAKLSSCAALNAAIKAVVDEQANDAGLWFIAETCTEAYLQQALRQLHVVIEGKSPEQCALAAIARAKGGEMSQSMTSHWLNGPLEAAEAENRRLRAFNIELLAALEKIVELGHYPDESIARAALAKARGEA